MAVDLKSLNIKRHVNTFIKVLMDIKILGLLGLMVFTFYAIGYDTVFRPSMEQLKIREEAIQQQRQLLQQKQGLQSQYKVWEQQLKDLDIKMVAIPPGESVKVLSVTESSRLLELAKGKGRDEKMTPPLLPPHDVRTEVALIPGATTTLDLLKSNDPSVATATPEPAPSPQDGTEAAAAMSVSVPVERFDFEMKMSGTYPALVDFVNQLITQTNVIKINKVVLSKVQEEEEPDPKEFPDYPVKVEMTLSLSMFLYDAPPQP